MRGVFVTGIGTGVGKTVASGVLCRALGFEYWKPVQTGSNEGSDSATIRSLVDTSVHPESYIFPEPLSPHAAAKCEGKEIDIDQIILPKISRGLVVEGAGGVLVPLNDKQLLIDLIVKLSLPVILVARHYLGSINHTLLSCDALRARKVPMGGILFVGDENRSTESAIAKFSGTSILGRIPEVSSVNAAFVSEEAMRLQRSLSELR